MLKSIVRYGLVSLFTAIALWYMGVKDFFIYPASDLVMQTNATASANASIQGNATAANGTISLQGADNLQNILTPTNSTQAAPAAFSDDNALSLILESIDLTQGEGGIDLWKLKAQWANLYQDNGRIIVEEPRLTYLLKDDEPLLVSSMKGEINQSQKILNFMGEVDASHKGYSVIGPLLVYNGTAKTMTFPDGGFFTGSGMQGSAHIIQWRMEDKSIHANGNVDVTFANADIQKK